MNRNDQNRTPKNKVNWSSEVKDSGKLAGKIVSRFFSYLLNIILTIMLICFITGIIVCTVFAVYVKNYIDPEVVRRTRDEAIEALDEIGEGDHRAAYYERKIRWCNLLLKHAEGATA